MTVAVCDVLPLVPCTVTVPVCTVVVGVDELEVEELPPPPPPQPAIIANATTVSTARRKIRSFLRHELSPLPAKSKPMAIANDPPVHGKNSDLGACRLARVVGAVTVNVAVPGGVTELEDTLQLVPGRVADTLHASATAPLNPFRADTVIVEVPTFPVAPAVRDMVETDPAS